MYCTNCTVHDLIYNFNIEDSSEQSKAVARNEDPLSTDHSPHTLELSISDLVSPPLQKEEGPMTCSRRNSVHSLCSPPASFEMWLQTLDMCVDETAAEKLAYWGDFVSAERHYILAAMNAVGRSRTVQDRIARNLSKVRQHILEDALL